MVKRSTFELLKKLPRQEFPRGILLELLEKEGYAYPKDRISALLKKEAIVKVAKNWYVIGPQFRQQSLHLRWLSNIMYTSCLSLQYALWYYNMIPEYPEAFTAISPLRDFFCVTPVGQFFYTRIPKTAFAMGKTVKTLKDSLGGTERFFISTPGKALADLVWKETGLSPSTNWEIYLKEDLRIDYASLYQISSEEIASFARGYKSRILTSLAYWFKERVERKNVY